MYVIDNAFKNTLELKKSKFIGLLYRVNNVCDVKDILNNLKQEYKDASHICYAYIINENIKYFDDNEPSKTAGFKIYEALNSSSLNYTLGVVIRYFGGVKLGTGPLSRCYFKVIKEAIKNSKLKVLDNKIIIILETELNNLKVLNNIIKDKEIINKTFNEKVSYEIKIEKGELDNLINSLKNTSVTYKKKD